MEKKVLIIDDDRTMTKMLSVFLKEHGYSTIVASDGEEALGQVEYGRPDLIILDVQMPKMNGYTFLFEMRKLENVGSVPVIVLTCKGEMEDIFKVEGVREYLIKPFSNQDLLEKVQKYI